MKPPNVRDLRRVLAGVVREVPVLQAGVGARSISRSTSDDPIAEPLGSQSQEAGVQITGFTADTIPLRFFVTGGVAVPTRSTSSTRLRRRLPPSRSRGVGGGRGSGGAGDAWHDRSTQAEIDAHNGASRRSAHQQGTLARGHRGTQPAQVPAASIVEGAYTTFAFSGNPLLPCGMRHRRRVHRFPSIPAFKMTISNGDEARV